MGMECYFKVKYDEKKSFDFDVKETVGYFRWYYALSDYRYNLVNNEIGKYKYDEYSIRDWVLLSENDIHTMMGYVLPIYNELQNYTEEQIDEFDKNGYPEDFNALFSNNPFNPNNDCGRYCGSGGHNLILLHKCLSKILTLYKKKGNKPIVAFMRES